jgi:protein-S-isoprenylcysteine O-methyltransferase Ste14
MKQEHRSRIFASIAVIAAVYIFSSGPLFIQNIPILLSQAFAILFVIWALLSINFNKHQGVQKLPQGYFLVTKGIYEIIRHPIYAGIFLFLSGYVNGAPSFFRYLALTIFLIAIILKMLLEESVLAAHLKEYGDYQKRTHKLIPYLY